MSKKLKQEINELKKQNEEITDLLKRTQADFINYKNRTEKETKKTCDYAQADIVRKILPVLDSFELALNNSQDHQKFKIGIEMVYAQLIDILKQEGLEVIKSEGQFNPYKHEVLMKEKSDQPDDTILKVLQKGYEFKNMVIRHTKVKTSG